MALEFIETEREAGRPWLLSINPFDPHPPFDPPWEYYRRYEPRSLPGPHWRESDLLHQRDLCGLGVDFQSSPRRIPEDEGRRMQAAYYAMIEQIDTEFGRLLDHLQRTGLWETTLVIFTSDHGEALGDHGLVLKGCRFYEGSTRVPLMIRWPGAGRDGRVSSALVELIDLAPTLYEAARLETPYWVQGRSLGPVLREETAEHRQAVRCEFLGALALPDQTHATMYRDRKWKLITYHGKDRSELYDLEADPWEHDDLSGREDHQTILAELRSRAFDATVRAHTPDNPRVSPY
jgi:arylsulfatase A-like enzyme